MHDVPHFDGGPRCEAWAESVGSFSLSPSAHHTEIARRSAWRSMELAVGQTVELMGVENAGLDITGKRGTVVEIPASGLVHVKIDDSSEVVCCWPENLKILTVTQASNGSNSTST